MGPKLKQRAQQCRAGKKRKCGPGRKRLDHAVAKHPEPVTSTVEQHPEPEPEPVMSTPVQTASQRKLLNTYAEKPSSDINDIFSTTIVHIEHLVSFFKNVDCDSCFGPVKLKENKKSSETLDISLELCDNVKL